MSKMTPMDKLRWQKVSLRPEQTKPTEQPNKRQKMKIYYCIIKRCWCFPPWLVPSSAKDWWEKIYKHFDTDSILYLSTKDQKKDFLNYIIWWFEIYFNKNCKQLFIASYYIMVWRPHSFSWVCSSVFKANTYHMRERG